MPPGAFTRPPTACRCTRATLGPWARLTPRGLLELGWPVLSMTVPGGQHRERRFNYPTQYVLRFLFALQDDLF